MGWSTHASGTLDPPEVRNAYIHFIALVASMSAFAMGYDTSVMQVHPLSSLVPLPSSSSKADPLTSVRISRGGTMALPSFIQDFGLSDISDARRDGIQANIVSTFQAGCFFGALLTFPIAEKLGRRRAIMIASLVFCIGGTLMTAARGNMNFIYAGRVIAGLGIGASSLVVPVYISEMAPPSIRGRLVGIFEIVSSLGAMSGFWLNYITNETISARNPAQWVVPLGLQLLPGVLLFVGIVLSPESPRWLARGDDFAGAEKVLVRLRNLPLDSPYIRREIGEIRQQVEYRSTTHMSRTTQFRKLFQKGTRNRMGIGMGLMFLQSFTGVNIITYYSPRIFESLGITGTDTKLLSTGVYGIARAIGMFTFTFLVAERVGRRRGLIWGGLLGSIPLWYIGGYVRVKNPIAALAAGREVARDGWGYLAMVAVYANAIIICATWQGITWTYASEIFPLDVRMLCVAVTTASTWLGSFTIARATPYMITDLGYGTYFVFGAFIVAMALWAFLCIPETKGLSLEQMDALFAHSTTKAAWAQVRRKPLPIHEVHSAPLDVEKDTVSMYEVKADDDDRKE